MRLSRHTALTAGAFLIAALALFWQLDWLYEALAGHSRPVTTGRVLGFVVLFCGTFIAVWRRDIAVFGQAAALALGVTLTPWLISEFAGARNPQFAAEHSVPYQMTGKEAVSFALDAARRIEEQSRNHRDEIRGYQQQVSDLRDEMAGLESRLRRQFEIDHQQNAKELNERIALHESRVSGFDKRKSEFEAEVARQLASVDAQRQALAKLEREANERVNEAQRVAAAAELKTAEAEIEIARVEAEQAATLQEARSMVALAIEKERILAAKREAEVELAAKSAGEAKAAVAEYRANAESLLAQAKSDRQAAESARQSAEIVLARLEAVDRTAQSLTAAAEQALQHKVVLASSEIQGLAGDLRTLRSSLEVTTDTLDQLPASVRHSVSDVLGGEAAKIEKTHASVLRKLDSAEKAAKELVLVSQRALDAKYDAASGETQRLIRDLTDMRAEIEKTRAAVETVPSSVRIEMANVISPQLSEVREAARSISSEATSIKAVKAGMADLVGRVGGLAGSVDRLEAEVVSGNEAAQLVKAEVVATLDGTKSAVKQAEAAAAIISSSEQRVSEALAGMRSQFTRELADHRAQSRNEVAAIVQANSATHTAGIDQRVSLLETAVRGAIRDQANSVRAALEAGAIAARDSEKVFERLLGSFVEASAKLTESAAKVQAVSSNVETIRGELRALSGKVTNPAAVRALEAKLDAVARDADVATRNVNALKVDLDTSRAEIKAEVKKLAEPAPSIPGVHFPDGSVGPLRPTQLLSAAQEVWTAAPLRAPDCKRLAKRERSEWELALHSSHQGFRVVSVDVDGSFVWATDPASGEAVAIPMRDIAKGVGCNAADVLSASSR